MGQKTDTPLLEVTTRDGKQSPRSIRNHGKIPGVYYGKKQPTMHIEAEYQTFRRVFSTAGSNTIVELSVEGKKYPVLIYDVQYDPVTDRIAHIDFKHVDMNVEVTAKVKIEIIGAAPGVKNFGGVLELPKHEIGIKCLPKDLIHSIEVDVSGLEELNSAIHVKDLKVSAAIKLQADPNDVVVKVAPPRQEEVAPVAPVEGAEGAVAGAAPAEGAEGAPGAAVAPAEGGAKKEKKQ